MPSPAAASRYVIIHPTSFLVVVAMQSIPHSTIKHAVLDMTHTISLHSHSVHIATAAAVAVAAASSVAAPIVADTREVSHVILSVL